MILLMTLLLNWPFNYLISMSLLGKFSCFSQCSCWYTSTCRRFFQSWQRVFLQKQPDVVCPSSCQLKILRWMCGIVCIFSKVKWADSRTRWRLEWFALTEFNPCFSSVLLVWRFTAWKAKEIDPFIWIFLTITIATVNWTIHLFDYVLTAGTTLDLNLFLTFASYIYIYSFAVRASFHSYNFQSGSPRKEQHS